MLPGTRISTGALSFSTEVDANAVPLNGILVNPDGAICGYDGAPECFVGGFGLTNAGLLCISFEGTIAGYQQGLPFTSDGRLVIQADATPAATDAWVARTRLGATTGVFTDGWGPPRTGLLFYFTNAAPFTDRSGNDYVLGITVAQTAGTVLSDTATYSFPDVTAVCEAVGWVSGTDHVLYDSAGTPKVVTGAVIKAFNNSFAYDWSDSRGLAVYTLSTQTSEIALLADSAMALLPYNQPTAFFNGLDFTDKTSFDSGTPGSPGQWVLDNTGTLVNAGYDTPACQGFRLDGTTWRDTTLDTTPILASTSQPTRVSGTSLTGMDLGPELITVAADRDFSSDTGWWTKIGTTSSISGGVMNIVSSDGSGQGYRSPNALTIGCTVGDKYKITGDYTVATGGVKVQTDSGIILFAASSGNGAFSTEWIPSSNSNYLIIQRNYNGGANSGTFDNLSIKKVLPSFTNVYTPGTTFKRYNTGNTRPNVQMDAPGFLSEPARTNVIKYSCKPNTSPWVVRGTCVVTENNKIAPDGTLTGALITGLGESTVGDVYQQTGALGTDGTRYEPSFWMWPVTTSGAMLVSNPIGSGGLWSINLALVPVGQWSLITRSHASVTISSEFALSSTVTGLFFSQWEGGTKSFYLWNAQLELGTFSTSPVITPANATVTRAATVATFPTAEKIRSNDIAFRMIVVPRASFSTLRLMCSYTNGSNEFSLYSDGVLRKKTEGVSTYSNGGYTPVKDRPYMVLAISHSSYGMRSAVVEYNSGWGTWTDYSPVTTASAKANAIVGSFYELGTDGTGANQFTGNISLFETLPLPVGLTDPLAWAKAQWGIS